MREIARYNRAANPDQMSQGLAMPIEANAWENEPGQSNADKPYLRQRRDVNHCKTLKLYCDRGRRRLKDKATRKQEGRYHADQIRNEHGNLVAHRQAQQPS